MKSFRQESEGMKVIARTERPTRPSSARFPLLFLAQSGEDAVILQRRCVLYCLLAAGDVAEQAAHDLAGARLRQGVGEADLVGSRQGADLLGDMFAQLLLQRLGRLL